MPLINSIPERFRAGFASLSSLTEEEYDKIQSILSNAPFVSSIEKLVTIFSTYIELKETDIDEIFSSVGSLIPFIDSEGMINEIVKDIVSICEDVDIIEQEERDSFKDMLTFLLNNKQIYYASKAEDLIADYGNSFILSRILSDIRPVFGINLDEQPKAGVIVHNLTIHYQSNEEPYHKNISLTLTPENIALLKETLTRAEKKEAILKNIFDKSEMKNLND